MTLLIFAVTFNFTPKLPLSRSELCLNLHVISLSIWNPWSADGVCQKFCCTKKTCLHLQNVPLLLSRFLCLLFTCTFWQYNQKNATIILRIFTLTFSLYILTASSEKCHYDSPDFCLYLLLVHFNNIIKKVPLWLYWYLQSL